MGLDISIIQTEPDTDLGRMYAIRDAIEDSFDWRISGPFLVERLRNYIKKVNEAKNLTKFAIIGAVRNEETRKYLLTIPDYEFMRYVEAVGNSAGEFGEPNTHVFFEWDKLPGEDIYDSCSWTMERMFHTCAKPGASIPKCLGDSLVELEPSEVRELARKWKNAGWKMKLAKWIGFFSPDVCERMLNDICETLGHESLSREMDIRDIIHIKNSLVEICSKMKKGRRLWMTVSY